MMIWYSMFKTQQFWSYYMNINKVHFLSFGWSRTTHHIRLFMSALHFISSKELSFHQLVCFSLSTFHIHLSPYQYQQIANHRPNELRPAPTLQTPDSCGKFGMSNMRAGRQANRQRHTEWIIDKLCYAIHCSLPIAVVWIIGEHAVISSDLLHPIACWIGKSMMEY